MLASSIPTKIPTPFANTAVPPFTRPVPIPSQIGIQNGAASFTDGFPPLTFTSVGAGGVPPWGADFNGLLNQITAWLRWDEAGGARSYDSSFSSAIGGYPQGALIRQGTDQSKFWLSLIDNNTSNPDSGGAGWVSLPAQVTQSALAADAAPLSPCFAQVADNLLLANDGTNPTRDVVILPGACRDLADTTNMRIKASIIKRIDIAWAAGGASGAPAGGLDSGSARAALKTYHVYLIGKLAMTPTLRERTSNVATITVTGHALGVGSTVRVVNIGAGYDGVYAITAVTTNTLSYANTGSNESSTAVWSLATADGFDAILSQQDVHAYPAVSLPAGFTVAQCIGSVLTDNSGTPAIRAFTQVGDEFLLNTPVFDINDASIGTGGGITATVTITVPVGLKVVARLHASINVLGTGNALGILSSLDQVDQTPNIAAAPGSNYGCAISTCSSTGGVMYIRTNTSAQIRDHMVSSGINLSAVGRNIISTGWRDPRRRFF